MSVCKKIKDKRRVVCIGAMDRKIDIQLRVQNAPTDNSYDAFEQFTTLRNVWAMLETTRGTEFFDGVNVNNAYTHRFYIRFIPRTVFGGERLSEQEWVRFNDEYYDIIDVENLDERNEFIILKCRIKGSVNLAANEA